MTAPTGIRAGVGFRHCVIFALNSNGVPNATSTSPYEGIVLVGSKALTVTEPEPRRIPYPGDDTILSIDVLPPLEAITGELRVGSTNDILDALISGVSNVTVGEALLHPVGTEKKGYEPQVGILAYRQGQDLDPNSPNFGRRVWDFRIFPRAWLISRDQGYSDNAEERVYTVAPVKVTQHLWGVPFSLTSEGAKSAQMLRGVSYYKPKIVAWKADGDENEFLFPNDSPAADNSTISVFVDGAEVNSEITKSTTKITFNSAPQAGKIIVAFYGIA